MTGERDGCAQKGYGAQNGGQRHGEEKPIISDLLHEDPTGKKGLQSDIGHNRDSQRRCVEKRDLDSKVESPGGTCAEGGYKKEKKRAFSKSSFIMKNLFMSHDTSLGIGFCLKSITQGSPKQKNPGGIGGEGYPPRWGPKSLGHCRRDRPRIQG